MNPFRNIRIFPQHGDTRARITWEMEPGFLPGDVVAAFSLTGVPGSWVPIDAVAASSVGYIDDLELHMDGGHHTGYYRLMLRNADDDYFSHAVPILGDLTARDYGVARAIMRREFLEMRAVNGYPVWHCVPRDYGTPALNIDPDTLVPTGIDCRASDAQDAFGQRFQGGFFPPILTWMRPASIKRGTIRDSSDETTPEVEDVTSTRLLAFPQPLRGHMIVDSVNDRRYVIQDEIKPFILRGMIPIAYEVELEFIPQGDARYRFGVPVVDMREYRNINNWW